MTEFSLPKLQKEKIVTQLKRRKLEDYPLIEHIESYFRDKRGYVFKMPQPGSSVILLFSGGVDSLLILVLLLKVYKLTVYPLVRTSISNRQEVHKTQRTIRELCRNLSSQYPNQLKEPYFVAFDIPTPELGQKLKSILKKDPKITLNYISEEGLFQREIPDFNNLYLSHAAQYLELLRLETKNQINTIFTGIMRDDGNKVRSQTLTAQRTALLNLHFSTGIKDLQVSALAIEKEIGFFFNTEHFLRKMSHWGIPFNLTWSCYFYDRYQCGYCLSCQSKKYRFSKVALTNPVLYYNMNIHKPPYFKYLYKKYVYFPWIELKRKFLNQI